MSDEGKRWRRLIHFDLLDAGLDYFHLDSAATYHHIRVWMDEHGFDHDQLSGYISRKPLTDDQVMQVHEAFIMDNPRIAACCEGWRATEIGDDLELGARTTRFVKRYGPDYERMSRMARQVRDLRNQGKKISWRTVRDVIRSWGGRGRTDGEGPRRGRGR